MTDIVGWDIGGANVKAACLSYQNGAVQEAAASRPYEIWRKKDRLPVVLRSVLAEVSPGQPQAMAVTMTAELADVFETKREGVLFVLHSLIETFPNIPAYALSLAEELVPLPQALERPLDFAASNWLATSLYVAGRFPDCILIDVGSTTTDIIPIEGGRVAATGGSDLERLIAGELVYTGALRTNLAAIVQSVPVRGRRCTVASEYFAVSGDVHLILGHLEPEDYTCPTPDGRPPALQSARQRLARLVCADGEMLSAEEIDQIARFIHQAQILQIVQALHQVLSRRPAWRGFPILVVGSGAFLAHEACRLLGLAAVREGLPFRSNTSGVAPSLAVARLLADQLAQAR